MSEQRKKRKRVQEGLTQWADEHPDLEEVKDGTQETVIETSD